MKNTLIAAVIDVRHMRAIFIATLIFTIHTIFAVYIAA